MHGSIRVRSCRRSIPDLIRAEVVEIVRWFAIRIQREFRIFTGPMLSGMPEVYYYIIYLFRKYKSSVEVLCFRINLFNTLKFFSAGTEVGRTANKICLLCWRKGLLCPSLLVRSLVVGPPSEYGGFEFHGKYHFLWRLFDIYATG